MFTPRFLVPVALIALALGARAQTTWYVDAAATPPGSGTQVDPYASIQFALSQGTTLAGDTVLVAPGTYVENVNMLGKDVHLLASGGSAVTVIDGGASGSTLRTSGGETLACIVEGFEIRGGTGTPGSGGSTHGGGVYVNASACLVMSDCRITTNQATFGGGLAMDATSILLYMEDCEIEDNVATPNPGLGIDGIGGGVWASAFTGIQMVRCTVQRNSGPVRGGGLAIFDGTVDLVECVIAENEAQQNIGSLDGRGGGLFAAENTSGTRVDMTDCTVSSNDVIGSFSVGGGAAYEEASGTLRGTRFEDNTAGDAVSFFFFGSGGGIGVLGGAAMFATPVLAEDCVFEGNIANGDGGGAYCSPGTFSGHATFRDCTFRSNGAQFGGGVFAPIGTIVGDALVEDSLLELNFGVGTGSNTFGGGAWGPLLLLRCEVRLNFANGEGGGAAEATLVECEVHHNVADGVGTPIPGGGGGAVSCTLTDCAVYRNTAGGVGSDQPGTGGGIYQCSALRTVIWGNEALPVFGLTSIGGGAMSSDLARCAVYDNTADDAAGTFGGDLEHCTVYGNNGAGVESASSVHNSIVRANTTQIVATSNVTYTNVEGGFAGTGNIDAPEIFWRTVPGPDGTGRDFHFASASSPGVDAGDPLDPLDADGTIADLGPYPWDPNWCPVPSRYCTPKITSGGCEPRVATSGTPTLTGPDDFHVEASEVPEGKNGLFFWGPNPQSSPFLGGTLCVGSPKKRTPPQTSTGTSGDPCGGAFDLLFTQARMTAGGLVAGSEVYGQYWFRDPPASFNIGLSDGVWWITCP